MQLLRYAKLEVPKRLSASFKKVCAAIERDDFFSSDVKKLTGTRFHRAKLDYENRLLLEFVEYAGHRVCLALELIEHHAYDKSRFLRGARVLEADEIEAPADTASVAPSSTRLRYLHPSRGEFQFLDKPISFDDRQDELFRLPLPMVLVGCAGSGKTALTLTKLRELPGKVLYVTQSAYLAESASSLYFSHGYRNPEQSVDFLSYNALLASIEAPAGRPVTLKDFEPFFRRHERALKFTTSHQLFEELRGVISAAPGAPLSLEAYLALGVRQSIYPFEQRREVHGFFQKYLAFLTEAKLYDSNLCAHALRPRAEPTYDAVVIDEVQDLTNAELSLVLAMLKVPSAFLLCGDANQIVHPNFFSWSSLKSLFYSEPEAAVSAAVQVLEVNYRSSCAVCAVANNLLKIKNARFGSIDRESTALVRAASDSAGKLIGLIKKDAVLRELNQRTRGSAQVAVLVLSEGQKAEARQKFSTPLVFSVHEAKGLEYDTVILYDIVSSERARFREIASGVDSEALAAEELTYRRAKDKADKTLEIYKFFVNALYVALTRAIETVYIVESDAAHPLLGLLRVQLGEDVTAISAMSSSLEDWQKEARRLELQGKTEQADAIRQRILQHTPVPWPVLDAEALRQNHERAFAPGSVFGKAKQRVYEFAAFHGLRTLAGELASAAGYRSPKPFEQVGASLKERSLGPYLTGDLAKIKLDVRRYGLEHRNMFGMTPLMMAAATGQLELSESLLEQGARIDSVDTLGRMPVHFALARAFRDPDFASSKLGPLFESLCPTALIVETDGKQLRLGRDQGEFLLLLFLVARFHELYAGMRRYRGFSTALIDEDVLAMFPRSVVPEERRRRVYWNGVLARAEVDSSYRPARRLWRRERAGHYLPSNVRVQTQAPGQEPRFVALDELLALDLLEPNAARAGGPAEHGIGLDRDSLG